MRRRHQERPQRKLGRVDPHRDPSRMRVRPHESKQSEQDQSGRAHWSQIVDREEQPQAADNCDDRGYRHQVSRRDWTERPNDFRAPLLLQSQRDREQPAHRRIDSVIRAERRDRYPRPRGGHG